ncbi:MAG: hypothetical protein ACJ8GK_07025 [Luteimonas sp.]
MSGPGDDMTPIADALPRHTTPTWEVELLISGVAVFAMLQLPGWLDDRWFALRPRLDEGWLAPLLYIYIYAKSGVLLLAGTFVMHLLLRARWIALVGMHSVHPAGIDWDRLRIGPVQREVEQAQYVSAESTIERADNRATTVFAIGVMLASLLLVISVVLLGLYAIVHWLAARLGLQLDPGSTFLAVFFALMAPTLFAARFDRSYGARMSSFPRARAWLARVFVLYGRLGFGQGTNPTIALLVSKSSRLRTTLMTMAVVLLAVFAAITGYRIGGDPARLGGYELFPRFEPGSDRLIGNAYYDDTRNPDRDDALPYIQSAVATGPYLKLVVPYRPRSDDDALRTGCPAIRSRTATASTTAASALACMQGMHAVALDGVRVAGLRYDIGADPRTDRPALVALIDVRALSPGRHALAVSHPLVHAALSPSTTDVIPFWR